MSLNYDEILPELIVGSCPDSYQDVLEIKDAGATALLSLQTDQDLAERGLSWSDVEDWCRAAGIVARREPVRDFDPENLAERLPDCARTLDELIGSGHRVYLHCTAGVNRSPERSDRVAGLETWQDSRRGLRLRHAPPVLGAESAHDPRLAAHLSRAVAACGRAHRLLRSRMKMSLNFMLPSPPECNCKAM
jgi:hypothetical protein